MKRYSEWPYCGKVDFAKAIGDTGFKEEIRRAGCLHAGELVIPPLKIALDRNEDKLCRNILNNMAEKCEKALRDPNTPEEKLFITSRGNRAKMTMVDDYMSITYNNR